MIMLVAIDTATRTASLAIHDGQRVLYEATWQAGWRHTVQMTSRLVAAMDSIALDLESLTGVAVALGPGSFTGLRVGMALAKGLVLARNIPLVGIPTLDVLAAAQGRDRRPRHRQSASSGCRGPPRHWCRHPPSGWFLPGDGCLQKESPQSGLPRNSCRYSEK